MAGVKGAIKSIGEVVGKPLADEFTQVTDAIGEQVINASPSNPPPPPQNPPVGPNNTLQPAVDAKKQQDELKRRNVMQFMQQLQIQENQYKQQKQTEAQQEKNIKQEDEEKKKIKKIEVEKKSESMQQQILKQGMARVEKKKGKF